jgi:formate C-acetyltransferase
MRCVELEIATRCKTMLASFSNLWIIPAPFMSLLMDGCIARKQDISHGAKYNNFGIHGTGLSTAVDSLTAIKTLVYEEKSISPADLVRAIEVDFSGAPELLHRLRYELPKMGDGSDGPPTLAARLLDVFADAVKDLRNERGGRVRAGTGSAMYYLWHANETGASADGRRKKEPFAANYSPSLFARVPGPVSVIDSFTWPNLKRVVNGGPLTLEFHSALFNNCENVEKTGMLVKWFIEKGGHQLQLNAVNRDVLLDAQAHPERHTQLIVRVWGWSAYFVELDRDYQDHVLRRQEYAW